jgi:hypothetical protein
MASLRNEEIETTTVRVARLEKEEAIAKAVTQQLMSQLRVI